ncbi:MAG: hypothetical protein V4686_01730 [Patescibacteria group bacterium]
MTPSKFFIGRAIGFLVVLALVFAYFALRDKPVAPAEIEVANVTGCYIATIQKDVYTLNVQSQSGENFSGTLQFKNFQKDSSSGTYVGTFKDNLLAGQYVFQSEGSQSTSTILFMKKGEDFVRGIEAENGLVQFDETQSMFLFKKGECK